MSDTILEQLRQALSFLVADQRFQLVEERYDPNAFGNAVIHLQSRDFAVRVVRDRGQIFADVGPAQSFDEWHDLKRVLEFLGHGKVDNSAFELRELEETLKANYNALKDLFSIDNYSTIGQQLKQFEREKTRQRLAALDSPPA